MKTVFHSMTVRRSSILIIFVLLIVFFVFKVFIASTPVIKDEYGKKIANSIAELEKVNINGIDQWLLIRGEEISKPVLLFLHGGPGSAEMCLVRKYNKDLEKDFVIVNWDQRGAGKSYSKNIPKDTMNVEQFVSDTHAICKYLKERFQKDKIILVGHSWGTVIGLETVKKYPEDFYAYIAVAQIVNGKLNETLSYDFTKGMALQENDQKAIKELETIGAIEDGVYKNGLDGIAVERKWLTKYGGFLYEKSNMNELLFKTMLSSEYNIFDKMNYVKGSKFSGEAFWEKNWLAEIKFDEKISNIEIPIYFFHGLHDYNAPYILAKDYCEALKALQKEFVVFENSAHCPNFEEAEKFNKEVARIAKEVLN